MSEPTSALAKTFDPAAIEAKWYAHWEETGAFRPARPGAEPFTIVNPPPNVTGSLHIGHALDNTLQDILIRHARLQGKDALWVVGTDHAGIATQMVVERQLNEKQQKRTDFSREEFVEKVWEWKAESGGEITRQLRRLGCSMDWANERFTMDEGFSKAVIKVFVDLYNTKKEDGTRLLYRDKRLVNWDPGLKTAISDLEVETTEVAGKFWHFRYPLADGGGHISVATTRPETMLADMAVAVSAGDPRYAAMVGKMVKLPITGREIPIIEDEHADPELGSGAVKITPGHDFNDFEVGKRAGFKPAEMLNMFDAEARVVQTADGLIPEELLGLTVKDARARVVELINAAGLLEKVEDRMIATPFGDRSGAVIEPWLTDQWYVDAETLAKPAIEAARRGAAKGGFDIVPKSWEKTFFNWMENILPWCVSRQLWWGHRIPAWYGPPIGQDEQSKADGTFAWLDEIPDLESPLARMNASPEVFVAETFDEALVKARDHYSAVGIDFDLENGFMLKEVDSFDEARTGFISAELGLWRDPDVLDTWFSSALWPFATLGWPDFSSPLVGEDQGGGRGASAPQKTSSTDAAATDLSAADAAGPHPNPPHEGEGSLLTRHYPNDVLVSGFDILFFWDARMAMQGLHFMKEVPWKTLYLHGLVRAADGQKMSKSKGNTVDPLGLIDRYGADALRFFMAAMESQGRDIKMDEKRVEGYRNFATKLWNAARFCQANGIGASQTVAAPAATLAVNKWIIGEVVETLAKLDKAFAEFRFDGMADAIYHFTWGTFCDWYLELIKGQIDDETKAVAGWVLDQILVMLHPFMPFITEELWEKMADRGGHLLIHAKWPKPEAVCDTKAKAEIDFLIDAVEAIRSQRLETGFKPSDVIPVSLTAASDDKLALLNRNAPALRRLARVQPAAIAVSQRDDGGHAWSVGLADNYKLVENIETTGFVTAQFLVGELTFFAFTDGFIDLAAERVRISAAIVPLNKEASSLAARLANPAFVEKAKPEAVEKARADHAEKAAEVERLQAALARLG